MKAFFTTSVLVLLQFLALSQTIKFKKEIQPLIDNKVYTVESKNLALKYHSQNTNPDGTLTNKAVLVSYDNVYSARVFIGQCYYTIGVTNESPETLDSTLYYLNLANGMAGVVSVSSMIEATKKKQNELVTLRKNKALKAEEEARKEKYSLKTKTVTFKSAEFTGNCRMECVDIEGNSIVFYNPILGKYLNTSTECGLDEEVRKEQFIITYQLETISIYSEDVGSSEFENPVLKSIVLADGTKEANFNQKMVVKYKLEVTPIIDELFALGQFTSEQNIENHKRLDTMTIVTVGADVWKKAMEGKLNVYKQKQDFQQQQDAQLTEQAKTFGEEQTKIKSSISCPTCPIKVLHSFLIALQNSDMPSAKKQMSECCYSSTASGCTDASQLCRAMSFSKLAESPKEGITRANKWLPAKDKWFVYFESATIAKVIITPKSGQYYSMTYFMLILENGSWKVYGSDDNERRYYIAKYAQGK